MNKKGFTLIELLAVIVVLAIVIVIAVPSVLKIQENIKKKSTVSSAQLFYKAADLCISSESDYTKCETHETLKKYYEGNFDNCEIDINEAGKIINFRYIDPNTGNIIWLKKETGITKNDISNEKAETAENVFSYKSNGNVITVSSKHEGTFNNFRIYGNSSGIGDLTDDDKYKIPIIITGKNLVDFGSVSAFTKQADGSFLANTTISTSNSKIDVNLPAEKYTLSYYIKCPEGQYNYRFSITYIDGTTDTPWVEADGTYKYKSFTTNGKAIKSIHLGYGNSSSDVSIKELQLEQNTEKTEYQEYKVPISYDLLLDLPLYEGDYIDFKTGKISYNGIERDIDLDSINMKIYKGTTHIKFNTVNLPKIEIK